MSFYLIFLSLLISPQTAYKIARLKCVFTIPPEGHDVVFGPSQDHSPLAYIELYDFVQSPTTSPPSHHGFHEVRPGFHGPAQLGGHRRGMVVRVDDIARSCQLIPKFTGPVNRIWTSENVLDLCLNFYVNNYLDRDSFYMLY